MTYTPTLANIVEPILKEIKEELDDLSLFDLIDEAESDPTEAYKGMRASVIPGKDTIISIGMQQLEHRLQIFIIFSSFDETKTPSDLRKQLEPAYDKLMEDVKHNDTCWVCLPKYWHAGVMVWPSGQRLVGVLSEWEARIQQTYSPPHA